MSGDQIILFLTEYKYILLFPGALVEGHIISLIAGYLARIEILNPYISWIFIVAGNLTGDVILYYIGYHKGDPIVKVIGKYIGVNDESIAKAKHIFHNHGPKILFFSKLTNGFGLAMAVLFTSGAVKMPFRKFFLWNVIGESIWSALLILLGYIFGELYTTIENVIFRVGLIGFAIILVFLFFRVSKYFSTKLIND